MSLVEMIDALIDEIGTGINTSTIRGRLLTLREQAEAVEAALQRAEADVKRLETYAQAEKIEADEGAVEQIGKQILRLLAQGIWPYLPAVAEISSALGIQKVEAEYHVDKLVEKGLVKRVRSSVKLTPKGRAYVVENKLV